MAERKLNFNAPLLSTRRMQMSAISVRRNKKKLTDNAGTGLDQIDEPASVPFTWEQAPGRLKGDGFRHKIRDSTQDFVPLRNPPGKVMDNLKYSEEKDSVGCDAVKTAIDENVTRSKGKQAQESDDDDDDVFSDALDTLSPKESCSINHSISGVSGYGNEMKKPPSLSEDHQSWDFMLNRFLPAAKAMTLEQPQYASKRQPSPVISEPTRHIRELLQTRQIRDIVPAEKCQTPNGYESLIPSYYQEDIEDEESEDDEDGESQYASSAFKAKRGCSFLPQLCFRNSLGMLTTVCSLKAKPHSLISSSHNQAKQSKVAQLKSRFQSSKKVAIDSIYEQKSGSRAQSPLHPVVGKRFNSESEPFGPNMATASRPSSPFRHSASMSPYRSSGNTSPFHPAGFPGTRKEAESLRANRLNKHIKSITSTRHGSSKSSVIEKTVYVDTETDLSVREETVSEVVMKRDEPEKNNNGRDLSLLAPPLPKKPSESWLQHNLPSVSSQNPSRRSPFRPQRKNLQEKSDSVTKWETMVKTSYLHKDHIRYSEELVAHTRPQSKTQ